MSIWGSSSFPTCSRRSPVGPDNVQPSAGTWSPPRSEDNYPAVFPAGNGSWPDLLNSNWWSFPKVLSGLRLTEIGNCDLDENTGFVWGDESASLTTFLIKTVLENNWWTFALKDFENRWNLENYVFCIEPGYWILLSKSWITFFLVGIILT